MFDKYFTHRSSITCEAFHPTIVFASFSEISVQLFSVNPSSRCTENISIIVPLLSVILKPSFEYLSSLLTLCILLFLTLTWEKNNLPEKKKRILKLSYKYYHNFHTINITQGSFQITKAVNRSKHIQNSFSTSYYLVSSIQAVI